MANAACLLAALKAHAPLAGESKAPALLRRGLAALPAAGGAGASGGRAQTHGADERARTAPHHPWHALTSAHVPLTAAVHLARPTLRVRAAASPEAWRGFAAAAAAPPPKDDVGRTNELLRGAELADLHEAIESDVRDVITRNEFEKMVQPYVGNSGEADATALVNALSRAGVVIVFEDEVFLKPKEVRQAVASALPPPYVDADRDGQSDYAEILKAKESAESNARSLSGTVLWAGFFFFLLQLGVLFRATFWELSWDVCEPISYFLGGTHAAAAYLYYLLTRQDFSFGGSANFLEAWMRRRAFRAKNIDERQIEAFDIAMQRENARLTARAAAKAVRVLRH